MWTTRSAPVQLYFSIIFSHHAACTHFPHALPTLAENNPRAPPLSLDTRDTLAIQTEMESVTKTIPHLHQPPQKNKHQPSNTEDKKSARLWSALCWSPCELLFQKNELLLTRLFLLVFFSLKPLDIEFMKRLHDKVNVIPLIAKADTLTPEECQLFKKQVLDSRVYISGIVFDRYHFMKYGARDGSSARLKFD